MPLHAIAIGQRRVGPGAPCFIIAEAGVNHNGDLSLAEQLVDVAAEAGADAVKFQTFTAERLVAPDAPKADYQKQTASDTETQYEMLGRLELPPAAHERLLDRCRRRGILFMSTPFDEQSADFLHGLGVAAFKVASGEITNLPFLRHVARKGKPLIVSTGMAGLGEVEAAVDAIEGQGNRDLVLLHCVSNYPADPSDVNLRAMATMSVAFGVPVGYSDHTMGVDVAIAATAMGACAIEKHFTLDRNQPGPDHGASLNPDELGRMVRGIRTVEAALGDGRKKRATSEAGMAEVARKSLVAACDIPAGALVTEEMLCARRPGTGLPPAVIGQVLGRTARRKVRAGTRLSLDMFE